MIGRTCGVIFDHLVGGQVLSVQDLAQRTGKHPNTVRSALKKLSDLDLACAVELDRCNSSKGWTRGKRSLADVATALNAEAAAERRRAHHQQDREAWQQKQRTIGRVVQMGGKVVTQTF